MHKYTNPFYTIEEAIATLKVHGTNPLQDSHDENNPTAWPEHVLGVSIDKRYADCSHYYTASFHLTEEGFNELVELVGDGDIFQVYREPFTKEHDQLIMEPSPLLKLFTLVSKEQVEA